LWVAAQAQAALALHVDSACIKRTFQAQK